VKSLTGTWSLVRLALRRDRIKLPLWILGISGAMAANIPAIINFYGKSYAEQVLYAKTTAPSVVSRVFGGPIYGPNIGEIVMNETFLFTAIAVAFMSTLAVIRHTRQNEETGRAELISSAVVGREASLSAALIVTIGANIVLGVLISLVFLLNDLPADGSFAVGASLAAVGIVFATIAAIVAQISGSTRGANSLAAVTIGVAFLFRAIGDGMGHLTNNGLGIASSWPAWLSPIGWGQQMYPFAEKNWWIFSLFGLAFGALSVAAYVLNARRDQGLGMFPARRGPVHAKRALLSPLGLAWRLQRGTLKGWAFAVIIMGVSFGLISEEFKDLFQSNPEVAEVLGQSGGHTNFTDLFFAAIMGLMAIALGAYSVQALLRMRSEESSGHLEPVLAVAIGRPRWMLSHVMTALGGSVFLLLLLGFTTGITYVLITGAELPELLGVVKAAAVHIPALLSFAAFVIFIFGILPGQAVAVSWASFAVCYLIAQFGVVLKLPQKILDISPFAHTPAIPLEDIRYRPLITLSAFAVMMIILGLIAFRRRDITTT
jgi:ABC-2 type transport system permease protein